MPRGRKRCDGSDYTGGMQTPVISIVLLLAVAATIALLVVLLRRSGAAHTGEAAALRTERDRLAEELRLEREATRTQSTENGRLNGRLAELDAHSTRLQQALAEQHVRAEHESVAARTAAAALADRNGTISEMQARAGALEAEVERLRSQLDLLQTEHAQATANLVHSRQANTDMQAFLVEAQTKLSGAFSELAGKVFDERGQLFEKNVKHATAQSKTDIETLLKPFSDQLGQFRTRVDTLYSEEAKERSMLLGAVTELKTLNQDMAGHTAALTRALKGSSKVRGDWGELMLESVLRGSGLEEGRHYDRQKVAIDEEGARLQPDIVVRLPDDRRVVVDSKVNLVAWQEAMNAETPEAQHDAMRRHAAGLRQHVKDLGEKNYPKAIGDSALEITIAFVPIEGALSAALGFDPSLQTDAFDRKIVFASPNTLMALLRVVERLWTRDKIQREAVKIAEVGGRVLDSLMNFLADFDNVGKRLEDANKAFNAARGKLSESSQAVIPRARRLAELGALGKKALSDELSVETPELLVLTRPE